MIRGSDVLKTVFAFLCHFPPSPYRSGVWLGRGWVSCSGHNLTFMEGACGTIPSQTMCRLVPTLWHKPTSLGMVLKGQCAQQE